MVYLTLLKNIFPNLSLLKKIDLNAQRILLTKLNRYATLGNIIEMSK